MTSLVQHAKSELRAAGMFAPDADYDGDVAVQVTSLMEVFAAYGHSGGSREQTLATFDRLARGLPITPLTGEDDEWKQPDGVTDTQIQVNKRCYRVVRDDEMAWDVNFGRTPISFPYTPPMQ